MRLVVLSKFLPDPKGSAGSRILHAELVGLRALGHDAALWSWWPGDPYGPLPDWVRWTPLRADTGVRTHLRAIARPRSDVADVGWRVPEDAVALAEDPVSFAAVRGHPASAVTVHYSTWLDQRALRVWRPRQVQDVRLERRVVREAVVPTAYSGRVADHLGHGTRPVPAALAVPRESWSIVEEPVAACVANWDWQPNRVALARLLAMWPLVLEALPAARLLLAGHGDPGIGTVRGVGWLGRVADSAEVLQQAAALVFPCPDTSGPKIKVLEAAASGLPVVTTAAGVEGLHLRAFGQCGEPVALLTRPDDAEQSARELIEVLGDAARRAALAVSARSGVVAHHAPEVAARARVAAVEEGLRRRLVLT